MTRYATRASMLALAFLAAFGGADRAEAAKETKVKILVTNLTAKADDTALADSVVSVLANEMEGLGLFEVHTMSEIKEILGIEAQKQALGCDDSNCFAELGGALGASLAVRGTLNRTDTAYLLNLQLIDVSRAEVRARVNKESPLDSQRLMEKTRSAVRILMRDILAKHAGKLLVQVSEEGSSIFIDDRLLGSSPLPITEVAGGTHTLRVEREGFVAWERDVDVVQNDLTTVSANLLPSAEFIRAYEASASRDRLLGWGGVIAAGVSVVTAGVVYALGSGYASDRDLKMDQYRAASDADFDARQAQWDEINNLNDKVLLTDRVSVGALVGAVALGSLGAYFLATGDDPDRYQQFSSVSAGAEASSPEAQLLFDFGPNGDWWMAAAWRF